MSDEYVTIFSDNFFYIFASNLHFVAMAVFALRRARAIDLERLGLCNLDPLTETYDASFYHSYMAKWPDLFTVAVDPEGRIAGYRK